MFVLFRRSYREVGLYWIGSIMNSMVVFMPGNVIGNTGELYLRGFFLPLVLTF